MAQYVATQDVLNNIAGGVSPPTVSPLEPGSPQAQLLDSDAHLKQRYIDIKYLGEGDNGVACAAISRAEAKKVLTKHNSKVSPALFDDLRNNLVVVKLAKDNNLEGDLTNEIEVLAGDLSAAHPSIPRTITRAVDSHLDGSTQWLALPYCNGGALTDFIHNSRQDLTLGFRWHMGAQLIESLLFLQFGVTNAEATFEDTLKAGHPAFYHGDVYCCNILLRPDVHGGYPDIVLADFGRAITLDDNDFEQSSEDDHAYPILGDNAYCWLADDVRHVAWLLNDLQDREKCYLECKDYTHDGPSCGHTPFDDRLSKPYCKSCEEFEKNFKKTRANVERLFKDEVQKLGEFSPKKHDRSDAFKLLTDFLKVAVQQREKTRLPMTAETAAGLAHPGVSNRDLMCVLDEFGARPVTESPAKKMASQVPDWESVDCNGEDWIGSLSGFACLEVCEA